MMQRLTTTRENAIQAWASSVLTGMSVIWDKGDGKRPAPPFATLNVIAGPMPLDKADEIWTSRDTFAIVIRKSFTLSIQAFGEDALIRCNDIVDSLLMPTRLAILQDAGFGVWGTTAPMDITEFMDTKYEGRAVVDIILAYADVKQDIPGEIHTVNIDAELGSRDIEINVDITP